MSNLKVRLSLILGTVVSCGFLWQLAAVPLGVPGEWVWNRIPFDADRLTEFALGLVVTVVAAGIYLAVVWLGVGRLNVCSRAEAAAWLAGLVSIAFAWLWIAQETAPVEFSSSKRAWVLYDPAASGYFYKAQHEIDDVASFMARYQRLMSEGDVLHVGTHPPGLFLLHRALIVACEQSPRLSRAVLATQPQPVSDAFSILEPAARLQPVPLSAAGRAALWLAVLLTEFAAAAAVVPIYLLARRDHRRSSAWLCAACWPLVPAIAVFLPKSDALFPLLGMLFLFLWLEGCRKRSAARCVTAGLVLWLGLFFSLALLPVGLLGGLLCLWENHSESESFLSQVSRLALPVTGAAVGFLVPVAILWTVYDLNLFSVWSWNVHNHAGFYASYPRTYWKWLLVNPVELSLAVGLPIVVLVILAFQADRHRTEPGWRRRFGPYLTCTLVWGLLWISGKNMGEAARLWMVLMPWYVWLTAGYFESIEMTEEDQPALGGWLWPLALQFVVCIATVTRVTGFHHQ